MNRDEMVRRLGDTAEWDVIVIGGGATGLGCGVDAAARGYRTILLEASDFGKGTSSRSTKLVHGGVRYLRQGNISLVREALRERGFLIRNAPHLVHAMPFVIPIYNWWEKVYYGAGLRIYDFLSGRYRIGRTQLVGKEEALRLVPTLRKKGLRGGVVYYDGQFDDARLVISLARTMSDLGGTVINYVRVDGLTKEDGRAAGVAATDLESGRSYKIRGKAIINATGVFADGIRKMDDANAPDAIAPSQGVHIVLGKDFLQGSAAVMVPRTEDGRVLFAIPWHGHVLVGTTDTAVNGTPLEPRAMEEEISFLISHARMYLEREVNRKDVLSTFAGLRPLVKAADGQSTKTLARDHTILLSKSGLVTITGGKWTTYRKMADDTVSEAARIGNLEERASTTAELRIHGWLDRATSDGDLSVYGADRDEISALIREDESLKDRLHPDLPYLKAEVVWATRHEMARSVEDILSRRLRALVLNARASIEMAPITARLMAAELQKDDKWEQDQVDGYIELAKNYSIY